MAARSCDNCYALKCVAKNKVNGLCENHSTLAERIGSVFRDGIDEWEKFSSEWEEARHKLRRLGGLE